MIKKRKNKLNDLLKRVSVLILSAFLVFTSVFSGYDIPVHAVALWEKADDWMDAMRTDSALTWLQFEARDALRNGERFELDLYEYPLLRSALNASANYYSNPSESGTRQHGGSGKSFSYVKNTGKESSTNQTNYNATNNYTVFNQNKTWNTATNNYDYHYNWYNPVTNTYNTTNNFQYNAEYNTYNYVTNNNYYTTNYYIQDNRTYVSYYIVNVNNETNEEEETYIEHYYELPDGRNSLDLTVDEVKGQYFISNYSKYVSVAEDDGTTLGLWHLDGDLKDSSFHNNTAGSSFNNVYTDGLYERGKKFSEDEADFLELKLDKVDLPEAWTLEWCEYIPQVSFTDSVNTNSDVHYNFGASTSEESYTDSDGSKHENYYYGNDFIDFNIYIRNYLSFDGLGTLYEPAVGFFVPYAIVYDGSVYNFYRNGVLVNGFAPSERAIDYSYYSNKNQDIFLPSMDLSSVGLSINSDFIKFYCSTSLESFPLDSYLEVRNYKQPGFSFRAHYFVHPNYNVYMSAHKDCIIDEVRLSNGILYTGDSYTPSAQPSTTNTVLAVPDNPVKHEIAFKTNTDISDVRFGGARPTYPSNGYVFVAIDSDKKVESVQQYQQDGWYEIEASVYLDDGWETLRSFDMDYFTIGGDSGGDTGGGGDSGGDTGGGSGGDSGGSGDSGGDTGGGGIQAVIDGIGKFFNTILTLIGKLIGMISDFVSSALSLFETLTVFTDGFSQFLSASFGFLPAEAVAVIVSGITLIVILAIIKFLRG